MIALTRVDNRLLHGQILEAWVPRLRARRVVVADDDAAASPLAQAAMTLALPVELPAVVQPVAQVDYAALAAAPEGVVLLFRDVEALARGVAAGLSPRLSPRLNVGNVHYGAGRHPVTPSVFLAADELAALERLAAAGFEIEARAVPSDAPVGVRELAQKYAAAAGRR